MSSVSKKVVKNIKKTAKKNPAGAAIIIIVILAIVAAGIVGWMIYNKKHNTYFSLNGSEKENIALNSNYEEKGATAVYQSEDVSDQIKITYYESDEETVVNQITTTEVKEFVAKYTIDYEDLHGELERHIYVIDTDDISINFLELGNYHTGDCTYIKAGETDILIDAGSAQDSADTIDTFLKQPGHVEDGKLEYVIVTHAHEDHIAGFTNTNSRDGIFKRYQTGTIIEFAQSGNVGKSLYNKYAEARNGEIAEGTTWYTANQFFGENKVRDPVFELASGITLTVLYQKYYDELDKNDENEHSVCCLISQGDNNYLFTGDLEAKGEASLVENNDLPEVTLFKGGHHGSKTSNTDTLLSVIKPKVVCICCCAGNDEYTDAVDNQFPTQAAINRIGQYTDKVYVTTVTTDGHHGFESMNGDVTFYSKDGRDYEVSGSNNSTILKDTTWFKNNRTWPTSA